MSQIHLWKEEAVEADGLVTVGVTIEHPDGVRSHLWYRLPVEHRSSLTQSCDPFVIAVILMAMNQATDLMVHGDVSPSLLRNLEEFQVAWSSWLPDKYRIITISAQTERDQDTTVTEERAIAAFSGGVDSSYSVFRHRAGRCGRWQRNLQAGLMVHGFDIPLQQEQHFNRAAEKSKVMLASLGVDLIPMTTNFRQVIKLDWEDVFGTAIASGLSLLGNHYTTGLVPSSDSYQSISLPYGSNPVTDRFLSSRSFEIIYDGSATRAQKLQELGNWSEAMQNLRVCWQGSQKDRNCGRCEKCIRTILSARVAGLQLPECFEQDVTDRQILELRGVKAGQLIELKEVLNAARAAAISEPWVKALNTCIKRNQRMASLKQYLPDTLKQRLRQLKPLPTKKTQIVND